MKYGLGKECKSQKCKKQWKSEMENELKFLKCEVSLLKDQLLEVINTVRPLTEIKAVVPSFVSTDSEEKTNPFYQNGNNNNVKQNDYSLKISGEVGLNSDHKISFETQVWPTKDTSYDSEENINPFCPKRNNIKYAHPFRMSRELGLNNDYRICFNNPAWSTGDSRFVSEENMNPFCEKRNSNNINNYSLPFKIPNGLGLNNDDRVCFKTPAWPTADSRFGLKDNGCGLSGTVIERYTPTWGYEMVIKDGRSVKVTTSHQCITSLPEYINKSFEELRLEDYILKPMQFSSPMHYTDIKSISTRAERRLKFSCRRQEQKKAVKKLPGWSWSAPLETTTALPDNRTTTETQSGIWNISKKAETPPNIFNSLDPVGKIDGCKSQKNDKLLGDVFLVLRKMTTNLSNINSHLTTMESNMSEMSSRVSVMDSRLAAVDMFVSMNRVNEKWQNLESKLVNLESPPLGNNTKSLLTEEGNTKNTPKDGGLAASDENVKSSSVEKPSSTGLSTTETDVEYNLRMERIFSKAFPDIPYKPKSTRLKTNLYNGSKKISNIIMVPCHHTLSSSPIVKSVKTPSENVEKDQPNGTSVKNSLCLVDKNDQNVSFDESDIKNETVISSNGSEQKCQEVVIPDIFEHAVEKTRMKCLVYLDNDELKNQSAVFSKSEVAFEQETSGTKEKDLNRKLSLSDTENEYVMVDKADINDIPDQRVKEKELCSATSEPSSSENKDIKIFKDITEYLEVKKGKKKDLVYEFGFEVKPDSSLLGTSTGDNTNKPDSSLLGTSTGDNTNKPDSSLLGTSTGDNTNKDDSLNASGNFVKDDSFLTFMNDVIKNHSVKQPTHFTFTNRAFKSRKEKQTTDI